jgi:hypothetical protein
MMKSKSLAALAIILGIALSTSAFAQGRHDEKPHGQGKPAAESPDVKKVTAASGRHDEKPHGIKKSTAKKDATKPADDKGSK